MRDGLTNAAEQTAGSHPRGTLKRYLAEGVTNGFFNTRFAIANPQAVEAHVLLTFVDTDRPHDAALRPGAGAQPAPRSTRPRSRR